MKKILLSFLIIFIISSCGDNDKGECHNVVALVNKSDKIIYFGGSHANPQIASNPLLSGEYFKITPGTFKQDISTTERGCFEGAFKENNNMLYFFFFDEEVLINNSWEDIVANDMILKRYSFTLQEMQAANWVILINDD